MKSEMNPRLIIINFILLNLFVTSVLGYPRTRSIKKSTRTVGAGDNGIHHRPINNDEGRNVCESNVPCGWALYSTAQRALRPIYDYTPNTSCHCSSEDICVFTRNRLEISLYVFHCRSKEQSRHLYKFPYENK